MKRITITILLLLFIGLAAMAWLSRTRTGKRFAALHLPKQEVSQSTPPLFTGKLSKKAIAAKSFAAKNGFNTGICFLIDMSLPSSSKRFFVYDMSKGEVVNSGLVAHGRCGEDWLEGRRYGNAIGCMCTSLGRYKVGYSYNGKFGLAFKLYGLDATNSNAFARFVVLHAHSCVPETAVDSEICQSDGCPTVSPGFLKEISPLLKSSNKPVLMWIYE